MKQKEVLFLALDSFLSRFLLFSICSSSKCMFVNLLKDFVQMLLTFTHEMSADNSQVE